MKNSFNQYVLLWNIVPKRVNVTPIAKFLVSDPAAPDTHKPINTIIIPIIYIILNLRFNKILLPNAFHIVKDEYNIIYIPDPKYIYPIKVMFVPHKSNNVIIKIYFHIDLRNYNLD